MIHQVIKPSTVLNKLKKLNVPQFTYAVLVDCSPTLISMFLSGEKGLSYEMQLEVCRALEFLTELSDGSSVPIDFRQVEPIVALWKKYKAKLAASEVIRSAHELERAEELRAAAVGK